MSEIHGDSPGHNYTTSKFLRKCGVVSRRRGGRGPGRVCCVAIGGASRVAVSGVTGQAGQVLEPT